MDKHPSYDGFDPKAPLSQRDWIILLLLIALAIAASFARGPWWVALLLVAHASDISAR